MRFVGVSVEFCFFFFKQKTAYEILRSDWSSDVCSSDLLQVSQVSLNQGVVRVFGKGGKERLVPMGEEALHWLNRFLAGPRAELLGGLPSEVVFPSARGSQMTRQTFWYRIKLYAQRAGIAQNLSPHT